MQEISEQSIDTNEASIGIFTHPAVKLTLKTIMWFLVGFSLFCVFFTIAFPYRTMNMYRNMGLRNATLNHASRVVSRYQGTRDYNQYLSRNNIRFGDALFTTSSLSGQILNERIAQGNFSSSAARQIAARNLHYSNLLLDEYSPGFVTEHMHTIINPLRLNSAISRNDRPHLYRYETVLRRNRVRSRYVLGERQGLIDSFTNQTTQLRMDFQLDNGQLTAFEIDTYIFLLQEINALIELELMVAGYCYIRANYYDADGNPKPGRNEAFIAYIQNPRERFALFFTPTARSLMLIDLQTIVPELLYQIQNLPFDREHATEAEMLRRTWWIMHLSRLTDNIQLTANILREIYPMNDEYANAFSDWFMDYGRIFLANGDHFVLGAWFNQVLREYFLFRE